MKCFLVGATAALLLALASAASAQQAAPPTPDLVVLSATYAAHDNAGQRDIKLTVNHLCQRQTHACTVPCDNVTYGDPTPGHGKFCEIVYRCENEEKTRTARSEENTPVAMVCKGCG